MGLDEAPDARWRVSGSPVPLSEPREELIEDQLRGEGAGAASPSSSNATTATNGAAK
jgi:hypothetical protein